MEKKIAADNPVTVTGVTIIPATKLSLDCQRIGDSISCFGLKQPFSVVLVSQSTRKAFNITGEEVSLGQLVQEAPDIEGVVKGLPPQGK